MDVRQFYKGKTVGFIALLFIIGVIFAFYSFNNYIYQEKQGSENKIESYRGTLSGEYVCLPHKDLSGPQTDECAAGLKTEVLEYYALDFNLMSETVPNLTVGDRLSASGLITPVEMLSSDHWQNYSIEGIFSVTDSLQVE